LRIGIGIGGQKFLRISRMAQKINYSASGFPVRDLASCCGVDDDDDGQGGQIAI
jgi:hypothetical protein